MSRSVTIPFKAVLLTMLSYPDPGMSEQKKKLCQNTQFFPTKVDALVRILSTRSVAIVFFFGVSICALFFAPRPTTCAYLKPWSSGIVSGLSVCCVFATPVFRPLSMINCKTLAANGSGTAGRRKIDAGGKRNRAVGALMKNETIRRRITLTVPRAPS